MISFVSLPPFLLFFEKHLWALELSSVWLQGTRTQLPHRLTPNTFSRLLSSSAEKFGLHNDSLLWELSLPQNFVVAQSHHINDRSSSSLVLGSIYPRSTHWPRSTFYQGRQLGRSSGSSLSGNASYQLSHSNLDDICQSWSCDDACHQHYLSLLGASNSAMAMAHRAQKFLGFPQSG